MCVRGGRYDNLEENLLFFVGRRFSLFLNSLKTNICYVLCVRYYSTLERAFSLPPEWNIIYISSFM